MWRGEAGGTDPILCHLAGDANPGARTEGSGSQRGIAPALGRRLGISEPHKSRMEASSSTNSHPIFKQIHAIPMCAKSSANRT